MATPLPTIYTEDAAALVRHALTLGAGILVTKGVITADQGVQLVPLGFGVVTFAVTIAWSWWQKHQAKQTVLAALLAKPGATEAQVQQQVAAGICVPSVLTPPTAVPVPIASTP